MKILITGGSGLVGSRFVELKKGEFEVDAPSSEQFNILNPVNTESYINDSKPQVLINFAAFTNVDGAEEEADDEGGLVYRLNSLAPANLVRTCGKNSIHFIHISTDYVFDGRKEDSPYTEEDKANPVNWYGQTKYFGEQFVLDSGCHFTIVRIEMPYSAKYDQKSDMARFFLNNLKDGKEIRGVSDQKITPVFVDDAIEAISKIAMKKPIGIYHVASTDFTTPYDFAVMIAKQFNLDKNLINAVKLEEFSAERKAIRPRNSWLSVTKFVSEFGDGILKPNVEGIKLFLSKIT